MRQKKRSLELRDMVFIGMLASMCMVAIFIKIPFGSGAMIHMGTACIFLIGILFGGVYAGFAAAIGAAFFDLLMGFSPYTVWSFVIKGTAGYVTGTVARGVWPESFAGDSWVFKAIMGMVLGALCNLAGYMVAWWVVLGSFAAALANMPSSLITSGVGMVVAMALAPKLRRILRKL